MNISNLPTVLIKNLQIYTILGKFKLLIEFRTFKRIYF